MNWKVFFKKSKLEKNNLIDKKMQKLKQLTVRTEEANKTVKKSKLVRFCNFDFRFVDALHLSYVSQHLLVLYQ